MPTHGPQLVVAFVAILNSHGLSPESVDPWRAWLAFKEFARNTTEFPDPGVSVQVATDDDGRSTLRFVRQLLARPEQGDDGLEPAGGVVCEFAFRLTPPPQHREYWTLDFGNFQRFVDAVERDPVLADLFLEKPAAQSISWIEA
ncbi:MAG TPA: hypothetical protein VJR92_12440 [Gemmatimonadaceae bacterium]|nr:hypothetical protein [Gemmatimonadaceae bacterium]